MSDLNMRHRCTVCGGYLKCEGISQKCSDEYPAFDVEPCHTCMDNAKHFGFMHCNAVNKGDAGMRFKWEKNGQWHKRGR